MTARRIKSRRARVTRDVPIIRPLIVNCSVCRGAGIMNHLVTTPILTSGMKSPYIADALKPVETELIACENCFGGKADPCPLSEFYYGLD
jgi:hypothetical protein